MLLASSTRDRTMRGTDEWPFCWASQLMPQCKSSIHHRPAVIDRSVHAILRHPNLFLAVAQLVNQGERMGNVCMSHSLDRVASSLLGGVATSPIPCYCYLVFGGQGPRDRKERQSRQLGAPKAASEFCRASRRIFYDVADPWADLAWQNEGLGGSKVKGKEGATYAHTY